MVVFKIHGSYCGYCIDLWNLKDFFLKNTIIFLNVNDDFIVRSVLPILEIFAASSASKLLRRCW